MLGGHTRVSKSVDGREVGAWWECRTHPTRWKIESKNLGRKHLELSERRRVFAREKQRGKRAERKFACKKHKAARERSQLEELTFGTFNIRTAAVNGVNGIRHIDTLLRSCVAKDCDVIGLQETKRYGTPKIISSGSDVFFSGDCSGVKTRKGQHQVGLSIKEEIVKKTGEDGITIECISVRLLKARISIKSNFATFFVVPHNITSPRPRKRRRGRRPNTWQLSTSM